MSLHTRTSAIGLCCRYRPDSRQSKRLNSRINGVAQEKRSNYCNFCNVRSLASVLFIIVYLNFLCILNNLEVYGESMSCTKKMRHCTVKVVDGEENLQVCAD